MYLILLFKFLLVILPVLISVAFVTLLERNLLGVIGFRLGPNKVFFQGILQPIVDAVKLMNKQINSLSNFYFFFYYLSVVILMGGSFLLWMCLFTYPNVISFKFSVLVFMLILSMNSLSSVLCGWSVFSKYSLIGSMRTVAQLISYEAVLYLCVFFFVYYYFSFSYSAFFFLPCLFFMFLVPYCFFIWVPSFLAELNRTPYDFSEGESELVSGFNTEFGSSGFTFIFLSEYGNILFFCLFSSFLFFLGMLKIFFFFFFFFVIWFRSVVPRYRFDKLMSLAWKFFIPFLTVMFIYFLVYMI